MGEIVYSMKNKKSYLNKNADISVLLIVFMAVILYGSALFIFIFNSNTIKTEITDARYFDDIYFKENEINFYVDNIMDRAVVDFKSSDGKDKFVEKFNFELQKYTDSGVFVIPELSQINMQAVIDNVELSQNQVSINFNISLENKFRDSLNFKYTYNKKFTRTLV